MLNGTQSATAGTAPAMNDVTASDMRWLTSSTSLAGSTPLARSALSRKTWAVVPVVVEIFLPLRSAKLFTPRSSRTQSCAVANSTLLITNTLPWPRAGKFESTAPVASMSMLPPIMAWKISSPVVNCTSSRSRPSFAKLPRFIPVQIWPSTASVCR